MSHFEIGAWVDFVRGIRNGSEAEGIAAHLETGCAECLDTFRWLQNVVSAANSSVDIRVPQNAVRRAQNLFERRPRFRFDTLFPLTARLVLDARPDIQPAGLRSAGALDHSLYRAGDFTIDLRQESARGLGTVSLVGQVSRENAEGNANASFPVAVFSGNSMLANSMSNEFGEFSLTYSRRPDLKLAIAVADTGRKIEIPLIRNNREKHNINKEE